MISKGNTQCYFGSQPRHYHQLYDHWRVCLFSSITIIQKMDWSRGYLFFRFEEIPIWSSCHQKTVLWHHCHYHSSSMELNSSGLISEFPLRDMLVKDCLIIIFTAYFGLSYSWCISDEFEDSLEGQRVRLEKGIYYVMELNHSIVI